MLDESIVQFHGRIRVHATKRVESKRNEVMAVPVTDLPVRPDVVVVEPLKGRHGASPSASSVLYTINSGRITDGHVQNVRPPALIGDMEVRPFAGRGAILIGLKRELIRGGVTPPVGVDLKAELAGYKGERITDSVVAPGPRGLPEGAHDGMRAIDASTGVTARVMRGSRGKPGVGHAEATTECQAPRIIGERCEVLVAVVNEAGDVFHRRLNKGGVHVLPSIGADDRPDANELLLGKVGNHEERFAVGLVGS
jgi:hypothetical protein